MDAADIAATFEADDYLYFYTTNFTEERNREEADEICGLLGVRRGDVVLDAPCGHGRITNILAARGIVMTGVDITPEFIDRASDDARQGGVDPEYKVGDLRNLPLPAARFDAAFSWFTSFGYFDDADNRRVLDEYRRVLRPDGALLIETLHLASILRRMQPTTTIARGDDLIVDATAYDVDTSRLETTRTVIRAGAVRRSHHGVRLHTVPELRAILCESGFSQVEVTTRRGEPLELDSPRLVVVAR